MALEEFAHFFGESKISTKDRNKLDDSQFGIPSLRKYPLTDEEHVLQALRFFNKAPAEHKKELALNIQKRGKELKMEWWKWFYSGATLADYKEDLSLRDQHTVNGYYTRDKQHEKMPEKKAKLKKKMDDKKRHKKYFGESDEPMKNLSSTPEADKCLFALKDVKYDNSSPQNWILRTPDEVIIEKLGNCHDTALYVYSKLDEFAGHPVDKGVLFFIEYNSKSMEGNQTHSVCFEKIDGGICIIEHSWEEWKGTFPYPSINEYIQVARNNWKFSGGCDALFVTEMKNYDRIKPGMNLKQYVDVAMKNEEIISESFTPDNTSGTSDFDDDGESDPDDCFTESADSNGITNAKLIAARIHEKVQKDSKPPTGNQNCQVCVWCAEAQFRGRTDMPRPVYSPRDPVLNILGESIVIHPRVYQLKAGFDDMLDTLTEHPYARFYCHAKWKEGHGGHEFLIITENGKGYIMDPQQGTVDKLLETHSYIKDLKWEESYLARMDDAEFNETVLRDFNTEESIVPWDAKLDIPYMLEHGMISKEEAEQYWKDHPDEAPKDRHFLTFEELDKYGETKNKKTVELTKPATVFTTGDFAKYGKDVDLNKARGPIQEATIELPEGVWMRHATKEDLPNIIQWKIESVSEKIRDNPKTINFIKKDANDNLKDTKMIMSNDDVIGVLESCWIDNNEWWYIGEIYLIPAYRGKGIAKALLKLDIAGKDKVKLRVAKENKHAIDLYESLGFKISEEDDNSYIMIIDKTKPIQESQHCISYAMGVDPSIMKLKKDGFIINEDDTIPFDVE